MPAAVKKTPKPERTPLPLYARISAIQDEISAFIDARAAEVKLGCPGLPIGVIRRDLIARFLCPCQAALGLIERDVAEKARIARITDAEIQQMKEHTNGS